MFYVLINKKKIIILIKLNKEKIKMMNILIRIMLYPNHVKWNNRENKDENHNPYKKNENNMKHSIKKQKWKL